MAISVEDFYRSSNGDLAADLRHRLRALFRKARAKSLIRRAHHTLFLAITVARLVSMELADRRR